MPKRILILTTETVMLKEYGQIARENLDLLEVLLIGSKKEYLDEGLFVLHSVENSTLSNILSVIEGRCFDYVFTYDEKLIDIVKGVADAINAVTYNIAEDYTRDKYSLKRKLTEVGLTVPKAVKFKTKDELITYQSEINLPAIIKPTSSYGSNGVKLVKDWEECLLHSNNVLRINKLQELNFADTHTAGIVEEFIDDEEYAIEIIWENQKPIAKGIMSRIHDSQNIYFPDYVYYTDPNISQKIEEELFNIGLTVGKSLGVINGATHTEVRYKNNIPYVLENAIRPGGGGYLYKLFSKQQSINFLNLYYKVMTGSSIAQEEKQNLKNNKYYFLYSYPNNRFGVINDIYFREKGISEQIEIISQDVFLKKGDKILSNEFGMRYSFFILGSMDNTSKQNFVSGIKNIERNCVIEFS